MHYRLDVNDAARALKLLTDNGFSARNGRIRPERLYDASSVRGGGTAAGGEQHRRLRADRGEKKTLSDAFLEATGKRRRAKKK